MKNFKQNEIKFRIWKPQVKSMMLLEDKYVSEGIFRSKNEDHVLMQYTGLHGKDEAEIYVGDIVKMVFMKDTFDNIVAEEVNVVMMEDGVLMTTFAPTPSHRGLTYRDYSKRYKHDFTSYEVIGNIFENPELIEREEKGICGEVME